VNTRTAHRRGFLLSVSESKKKLRIRFGKDYLSNSYGGGALVSEFVLLTGFGYGVLAKLSLVLTRLCFLEAVYKRMQQQQQVLCGKREQEENLIRFFCR